MLGVVLGVVGAAGVLLLLGVAVDYVAERRININAGDE